MINKEEIIRLSDAFAKVSECPLTVLRQGETLLDGGGCSSSCPSAGCGECALLHENSAGQSERFGGKYIYLCPAGFMFAASRAGAGTEACSLCAGPMTTVESEDFIPADLAEPFSGEKEGAGEIIRMQRSMKKVSPERVEAIAELLTALSAAIARDDLSPSSYENERQQKQIGEYVQSVKARLILGKANFSPYPYEKEKLLINAISEGNRTEASRRLNEILGHIFFASANNLDSIKIRAMELTVLISRAALDAGADVNSIYQYNLRFMSDFYGLTTIEDVCFALTAILRSFMDETFRFTEVKHAAALSDAVSYMRQNYMHKLSLDDVAERVCMSPSYLSRIFKEEMSSSFNACLKDIRIEKSKMLLRSEKLSVAEVAELTGFSDQSYFNKVFRQATGLTPKHYRDQKKYII